MKRADVLRAIVYAGYHGDAATMTRLYIENRVSREAALEAYRRGRDAKAKGVECGCAECMATERSDDR